MQITYIWYMTEGGRILKQKDQEVEDYKGLEYEGEMERKVQQDSATEQTQDIEKRNISKVWLNLGFLGKQYWQ